MASEVQLEVMRKFASDANPEVLEDILYRLLDEFQPELAGLGVEAAIQQGQPPRFFQIKPLDKLQARTAYSKENYDLENNQGDSFKAGFNGRLATFSRGQVGDFFSATLSPELRMNGKGSVNARALEGFAKFTQYNVEAGGGQESLWWGPGFNGSMLLSTNGRPFDLIKVGAAEQFTLPWIFEHLGPMKLTYFLGQLGGGWSVPPHQAHWASPQSHARIVSGVRVFSRGTIHWQRPSSAWVRRLPANPLRPRLGRRE
jgi:hypothetical protein